MMRLTPGITTKLAAAFILFAFVLLLVLGGIAYFDGVAALETATVSEVVATAIEKEASFATWLGERRANIVNIASDPSLIEHLDGYRDAAPRSAERAAQVQELSTYLDHWVSSTQDLLVLELIDIETATVLVSTGRTRVGDTAADLAYFQNGKSKTIVQNPYVEPNLARVVMTIATPVHFSNGATAAVLVGHLNLDTMSAILNRRNGLRETDDALMVNDTGLLVSQPRFLSDPAVVLQRTLNTEPIRRCLAGVSGTVSSNDYRGVPVIAAYRWLPEQRLCLIFKIEQQEAFAEPRAFGLTLVISGIGVIALAFMLAFVLARGFTRPLQQMVTGTRQIGAGNLTYRIPVRSHDEIGQLARAFNDMTDNLRASTDENERLYQETRAWADELERRVAERTAALAQSEERFRTIFTTVPVAISEQDWSQVFSALDELRAQGITDFVAYFDTHPEFVRTALDNIKILDANEWMLHMFEAADKNELARAYARVYATDEARQSFVRELIALAQGEREYLAEMSLNSLRGNPIYTLLTIAFPQESAQSGSVLMSGVDISKRKQAEGALRETTDYLESLLNYANAPIIVWDANRHITRFNHAFEQMTGYAAEAMLGQDVAVLFPDESRADSLRKIGETASDSAGWESVEIPIQCRDGRLRVALWNSANVYASDGRTRVATIAQGQDITERKHAEEKSNAYATELERSNRELEQFAYVASHDLQEPLRMVSSYVQLLSRRYRGKLDADADEFIGYAVDGASRMQRLINDLLAYSRVGTRGTEFVPTDSNRAFDQALANLAVAIAESNAVVTRDELPVISADSAQLTQLFQNLIGNALKFRGAEIPQIHVSAARQVDDWLFAVRDNGIGFEQQYADRIFVIFQRLHTRQEYPGTGIGLAICKRIVERHEGTIRAEGTPGKGATFYFTIPVERQSQHTYARAVQKEHS